VTEEREAGGTIISSRAGLDFVRMADIPALKRWAIVIQIEVRD